MPEKDSRKMHFMEILARLTRLLSLMTIAWMCSTAATAQSPQRNEVNQGPIIVTDLHTQGQSLSIRNNFQGTADRCNYSAENPPMQPEVALGRCQPCIRAVDCADGHCQTQTWRDMHLYNFQPLGHGQFQGPIRVPTTKDYRLRRGDTVTFIVARSREVPLDHTYVLKVGDLLQVTSTADETLKMGDLVQGRGVEIQPDGLLHLDLIEPVSAAGLTIKQLKKTLEIAYKKFYNDPAINVLPIKTNTPIEDVLESVDNRQGFSGGRTLVSSVLEDGTIRMNKIGAICVQGLTLDEAQREINLRFREIAPGMEISPIRLDPADHFVFIYGQVARPDRYQLSGPTSVTQALAQAGGLNDRGNAREIVIFRRAEDWRYLSTRIDLKGMHLGKVPTPADDIWLSDSDLVVVPLTPISRFNIFVDQVFRQGIYGVLPFAQVGTGLNASGAVRSR
jgi:polysaccharide biosynthesis/export protein